MTLLTLSHSYELRTDRYTLKMALRPPRLCHSLRTRPQPTSHAVHPPDLHRLRPTVKLADNLIVARPSLRSCLHIQRHHRQHP